MGLKFWVTVGIDCATGTLLAEPEVRLTIGDKLIRESSLVKLTMTIDDGNSQMLIVRLTTHDSTGCVWNDAVTEVMHLEQKCAAQLVLACVAHLAIWPFGPPNINLGY